MTTFNVAVVGAGSFAREHIAALNLDPRVNITHVFGRELHRAQELASFTPHALATTDERLVLDCAEVHAVDIVTATPDHAQWVVGAAAAGKHIHVEKPVCRNLAELDLIEGAITRSGMTCMVGQTVRFQPAVAHLHQQLRSGHIGEPKLVHLTWYTPHVWPLGWRSWQLDPALSGGHPVHNGVHAFDAVLHFLGGRAEQVFCRALPTWAAEMPTPDSFQVTMRLDGGRLAVIELCYALRPPAEPFRRILIAGTAGTLVHDTSAEREVFTNAAAEGPPSIANALQRQLHHWIDTLEGAAPLITMAQVRNALVAALAAQRSLETRDAVDTSTIEAAGAGWSHGD